MRPTSAGVCEDDDELRGVLRSALEREGLTVRATGLGHRGRAQRSPTTRPTCSCSTSACPTPTGATSARRCARAASTSPVLFLTARDALPDRISGFHAGGDDYLTKPFALAELLVRVQALAAARAPATRARAEPRRRGVVLDPAAHAVGDGDGERRADADRVPRCSPRSRRGPGEVVRRAALVAAAWPDGAIVHDNTLDAYVARIRRKLRDVGAPRRSRRCAASATSCGEPPHAGCCCVSLLTLAVGPRRAARRRQRRCCARACARRPTSVLRARAEAQLAALRVTPAGVRVRESANDEALDRSSWVLDGDRVVERPRRRVARARPRRGRARARAARGASATARATCACAPCR